MLRFIVFEYYVSIVYGKKKLLAKNSWTCRVSRHFCVRRNELYENISRGNWDEKKMERILVLHKPLPPTAASRERNLKRANTRDDDKLSFIVSYSEIVCNKIYVLITQKKLPANTLEFSAELRAHGIRISPLFHVRWVERGWFQKVTFSPKHIRRIGCLDGLCGATRAR